MVRIVFFGTPGFSAKILKELVQAGHQIVAIVTKPDKPKGRSLHLQPPYVKIEAERLLPKVSIFQPAKCSTPEMVDTLKTFQADLFVVVAFGEIISQAILDIPKLGCINVHASLLPKYRGAAPMQHALLNGEKETGISIIKMVRKMDAGDILYSEKLAIDQNMNLGQLDKKLCELGAKCILKAIELIQTDQVEPIVQDEQQATYANKIGPDECLINWLRTAQDIHNQIRALSPHPGAYCYIIVRGEKRRLKVLSSEVISDEKHLPKTILLSKNTIDIACSTGILRLGAIQLEGKPILSSADFLKGTPQFLLA